MWVAGGTAALGITDTGIMAEPTCAGMFEAMKPGNFTLTMNFTAAASMAEVITGDVAKPQSRELHKRLATNVAGLSCFDRYVGAFGDTWEIANLWCGGITGGPKGLPLHVSAWNYCAA